MLITIASLAELCDVPIRCSRLYPVYILVCQAVSESGRMCNGTPGWSLPDRLDLTILGGFALRCAALQQVILTGTKPGIPS